MAEAYAKATGNITTAKDKLSSIAGAASTASSMFQNLGSAMETPVFDVFAAIAQAVANIALAYSDAFLKDQASKTNIFAFIASVAAGVVSMATTIAAVKNAATYAGGGIVGGGGSIGDFNIARVNDREMILNGHQQENLYRILQGNGSINHGAASGEVEFKIRGQELVGVLNNFSRKQSKI